MASFYTRRGDDGKTSFLGPGRLPKYDLRMETLGALDEASAVLGLARAQCSQAELNHLILQVQRDLYGIMSEVAASVENARQFRSLDVGRVEWLEAQVDAYSSKVKMPEQFIIPGDSLPGAAFSLARTVVRRAERRVVEMADQGEIQNRAILAYLNRLSSLCFALEVYETLQAGLLRPTPARETL